MYCFDEHLSDLGGCECELVLCENDLLMQVITEKNICYFMRYFAGNEKNVCIGSCSFC